MNVRRRRGNLDIPYLKIKQSEMDILDLKINQAIAAGNGDVFDMLMELKKNVVVKEDKK